MFRIPLKHKSRVFPTSTSTTAIEQTARQTPAVQHVQPQMSANSLTFLCVHPASSSFRSASFQNPTILFHPKEDADDPFRMCTSHSRMHSVIAADLRTLSVSWRLHQCHIWLCVSLAICFRKHDIERHLYPNLWNRIHLPISCCHVFDLLHTFGYFTLFCMSCLRVGSCRPELSDTWDDYVFLLIAITLIIVRL